MSTTTKINKRSPEWYGWLPDLPDHRDLLYAAIAPKVVRLPRKIDLQAKCSPVENQGHLGSCTANALAGALEFLEKKEGAQFVNLSRLFIYYNERVIEGTVREDSGAFIRDGIKSLAKQGVCPEREWPYKINKFRRKPTRPCYRAAEKRRILSYHRINTVDEMRTCLADGFPFVFGFTVYESFESKEVKRSGVLNMPQKDEKVMGGHAVMAAGYDDGAERFLIRNSWGADWGKEGYFTMPYTYLSDRNLSDDFWTIRVAEEGVVGTKRPRAKVGFGTVEPSVRTPSSEAEHGGRTGGISSGSGTGHVGPLRYAPLQ